LVHDLGRRTQNINRSLLGNYTESSCLSPSELLPFILLVLKERGGGREGGTEEGRFEALEVGGAHPHSNVLDLREEDLLCGRADGIARALH